ncbi:unnamed protein product [Candida verbasci]|uniref:Protein kinase domain-containing protein n=1 Tax=Candida verbasci TaxID=1227364 RepID=A0A9W4X8N1_9ASCO|nr:unnamed protein product [Candida verbasci]
MYINKSLIYNSSISNIYKAEDDENNQLVCLKVVSLDFKIPPHSIINEIKALKSLNHPNILQYINHYTIGDDMYLVSPLYKYNLTQLIQKKYSKSTLNINLDSNFTLKNLISEEDIISFLKSMSSALAHIHQSGIIHRDIKPENIFFNEDLTQPVIGDFGICYHESDPSIDEPLNMKYIDVCSSIFQPPELLLGITDYSFEIDIWSLAIIVTVLFSKNLKSVLIINDPELSNDSQISALPLLHSIFKSLGTPTTQDSNSELFWPELIEKTHFKDFNLTVYPRLSYDDILPKCKNEKLKEIFSKMIKYDRFNRISALELHEELETL